MKKSTFMSRPKIKNLSNKEKEKRWRQHLETRGTKSTNSAPSRRGHNVVLPCTLAFVAAGMDPFDYVGENPCAPDMFGMESYKYKSFAKGQFSSGTNGIGYVAVNMLHKANASVTVNPWYFDSTVEAASFPAIVKTTNTFNANYLKPYRTKLGALSSGVTGSNFNFPYPSTSYAVNPETGGTGDLRVALRSRTVCGGVRIRYTGPLLYSGGTAIIYRQPQNDDTLSGGLVSADIGLTADEMLASDSCIRVPIRSGKWINLVWKATREEEFSYGGDCISQLDNVPMRLKQQSGSPVEHRLPGASPRYSLVIMVTGTQNASGVGPSTFDYEAIQFSESIGNISSKTRSHTDLNGLGIARNALPARPTDEPPKTVAARVLNDVWNAGFIQDTGVKVLDYYSGGLASEVRKYFL